MTIIWTSNISLLQDHLTAESLVLLHPAWPNKMLISPIKALSPGDVVHYIAPAIIFGAVALSIGMLVTFHFKDRRSAQIHLALDKANTKPASGRDAFNAILLTHLEQDLGGNGEPLEIGVFWREVSLPAAWSLPDN